MRNFFSLWIPLAIAVSCLCGLIYLVVQQDIRISANDPQIQLAQDQARVIDRGERIPSLGPTVDISESLAPFLIFFDRQGKVIISQATLHGQAPIIPDGIFSYVRTKGEDRFTWQPEIGVRIATVVVQDKNGFVLVGRSLREVEKREDNLLLQVFLGWAVTLFITFLATALFVSKKN